MGCIIPTFRLLKEKSSIYNVSKIISSPEKSVKVIEEVFSLSLQTQEVLIVLALNSKNQVIGSFEVHKGSLDSSIAYPREIFKGALLLNSASIIMAHNHPSGNPTPSLEDLQITNRVLEADNIIGINLLDHIIIGENNFISLKKIGKM